MIEDVIVIIQHNLIVIVADKFTNFGMKKEIIIYSSNNILYHYLFDYNYIIE